MIASRSTEKLEKVKGELNDSNPNIKVKVVAIDLTKNYDAITSDTEVMQNLGILVNNAGHGLPNKFFDQNPAQICDQHHLNLNAITILTKHAKNSFIEQNSDRKFGLIQVSSSASEIPVPLLTHYGATKRYDEWFSDLVNKRNLMKDKTKNIDTLIVRPGPVTTGMIKYFKAGNSCYPEETSRESLCDLGVCETYRTYGSMKHNFTKISNAFTPDSILH
jgi:short-subunit dehydrogenase